ncbi:MAG: ferritin family protein [Candidatus Brocadiaceae bacterium]|jgi:rubrerythrin
MAEGLEDAIQRARKLEIDGAEFYTDLADKCSVPAGEQMFRSFAKDEKRHLQVVEDVSEGLGVEVADLPMPRDEIRTLFAEKRETVEEPVEVSSDEQEAIRMAMEMESQSYSLYRESAARAEDEETRQLFERLSREENQHYEMLENTLEYLSSNAQWFLWKEWALIVGDQSSLGTG